MSLRAWAQRDFQITVLNFFTFSAYAPRAIGTDLTPQVKSRLRKCEDRSSLRRLHRNIRVKDFDFEDAPVRLGQPTASCSGPDAVAVRSSDVAAIRPILSRRNAGLLTLAPLGLGGHVDHRTVRDAAVECLAPSTLGFYEDLPYATWAEQRDIEEQLRQVKDATGRTYRASRVTPALPRFEKARLARMYQTQITRAEARIIADFSSKRGGGERLWVPARSRLWTAATAD